MLRRCIQTSYAGAAAAAVKAGRPTAPLQLWAQNSKPQCGAANALQSPHSFLPPLVGRHSRRQFAPPPSKMHLSRPPHGWLCGDERDWPNERTWAHFRSSDLHQQAASCGLFDDDTSTFCRCHTLRPVYITSQITMQQ